ncbi:MAG: molybdopterin molybdotransferase MoeA [Verrucomicrobiota bacterium]
MKELLPLDHAYELIDKHVAELEAKATSLEQAPGSILKQEIFADRDEPPFDRSAMDGFAVLKTEQRELGQTWELNGEIQPGDSHHAKLLPGQCIKIYTGACVPENARVIKKEDVDLHDNRAVLNHLDNEDHIRYRGTQAKKGEVLLSQGTELQAVELSICASVGMTEPLVSRRPRVIHVATGNELVDPQKNPLATEIRDSNSTLIACLLKEQGVDLIGQYRLKDNLEAAQKLMGEIPDYDLILFSGGASVGDYDIGRPLLEKMGYKIHFSRLNLRPGKPSIFGTKENQAAFVIPGNPVSHVVVFHRLVRRALMCMQGKHTGLQKVRAKLVEGISARSGKRLTFNPAIVFYETGRCQVRPLSWHHSGDLHALAGVNGLISIDPENIPKKGDKILVDLL